MKTNLPNSSSKKDKLFSYEISLKSLAIMATLSLLSFQLIGPLGLALTPALSAALPISIGISLGLYAACSAIETLHMSNYVSPENSDKPNQNTKQTKPQEASPSQNNQNPKPQKSTNSVQADELQRLSSELEALKAEMNKLKAERENHKAGLKAARELLNKANADRRNLRAELNDTKETLGAYKGHNAQLKLRNSMLEKQLRDSQGNSQDDDPKNPNRKKPT